MQSPCRWLVNLFFSAVASALCLFTNATPYSTLQEQCDGYPKLPIETLDSFCVGLLVQKSPSSNFKMPRTAIELDDGRLLVVDMGGWSPKLGKLWLINYRTQPQVAEVIFSNLTLPHKILQGPDNKYYLAEATRIIRFELQNNQIAKLETVIDDLPFSTEHLHPLKNFVFDLNNDLIVNIGSSSDRCNKTVSIEECQNGKEAALRRYSYNTTTRTWSKDFSVLATGLRNSMALAVHSSGTLIQAENSIDFSDPNDPYEELNVIEPGRFYGWPLCYNRQATLKPNDSVCSASNYQEPWTLLPPHVAPLDALYYSSNKLPALKNTLIMSWHGYKADGHRIVFFEIDHHGKPKLAESAAYFADPSATNSEFTKQNFSAKNGTGLSAQHHEIISHWNEIPGLRPKGAPVGLTVLKDGSLLIVDDKNSAILRLANGTAYKDKPIIAPSVPAQQNSAGINLPTNIQNILINRCSRCHEAVKSAPEQLFNENHWLQTENGKTRIEVKLFEDKLMPMPPDGSLLPKERDQLKTWLVDSPNKLHY